MTATGLTAVGNLEREISQWTADQGDLTPVERFAQRHAGNQQPVHSTHYRELLPGRPPAPGEQYAFEVNLDRCSGCKGCVTACHNLNGLDPDEAWRDVGLLIGERNAMPVALTVTTACHHCVEPACLQGCPVLAYEKDPATGIVFHLDDQCIGCSYCIMKCPYDVPRYSARRGIVRKCDLCRGRLAHGEAPACVQACPNEAIRVTNVSKAWVTIGFSRASGRPTPAPTVRAPDGSVPGVRPVPGGKDRIPSAESSGDSAPDVGSREFLPDSPEPGITCPTTRYVGERLVRGMQRADRDKLRGEPAHGPLVVMLTWTQLAAGLAAIGWIEGPGLHGPWMVFFAGATFGSLLLGLSASVLHLGRPLRAWRAFLGWRTSWMSREILLFQAFAVAASLWLAGSLADGQERLPRLLRELAGSAGAATSLFGIGAVVASAMVYIDTARPCWRASRVLPQFLGSALLLGSGGAAALVAVGEISGLHGQPGQSTRWVVAALLIRTSLWIHERLHGQAAADPAHPDHRQAQLARQRFRHWAQVREGLFWASTLLGLAALGLDGLPGTMAAVASSGMTLAAVLVERLLFFTTATAPRMPGTP